MHGNYDVITAVFWFGSFVEQVQSLYRTFFDRFAPCNVREFTYESITGNLLKMLVSGLVQKLRAHGAAKKSKINTQISFFLKLRLIQNKKFC